MSKDYNVGYKKPPKHTQFQPGQSGNPNGRPKGTKNLRTDLEEELQTEITITEGGQPLTISKQRALVMSLLAKAIKGDVRSANTLIKLILKFQPDESLQPTEEDNYVPNDIETVKRFYELLVKITPEEEIEELRKNPSKYSQDLFKRLQ